MKTFSEITTSIALNESSKFRVHAEVSAGNIPLTMTKRIPIEAKNEKDAHKQVRAHAKKQGWKVHQVYRVEKMNEDWEGDEDEQPLHELSRETLGRYIKTANHAAEKSAEKMPGR